MKDFVNFKGKFIVQTIDKNNNIIDEYVDNNLIMETARQSMSEIFANLNTNTYINKLKLGTLGHNTTITDPKDSSNGFIKERDRLFSEIYNETIDISLLGSSETIDYIITNDLFYVNAYVTENSGYYKFINENIENYVINNTTILDTNDWEYLGTDAPYTYTINFELPQTNDNAAGTLALNITEDDTDAGSTVSVFQEDTSVTFTFSVAVAAGNSQDINTTIFTEAALYANSRIFSMKTFKAKIKDSTVMLRIIWTITF